MRLRKRKTAELGRPASRVTLGAICWLLFSVGVFGVATFALNHLGANLTLSRAQTFSGALRPAHSSHPIILPREFVLEEVVVEEGDLVEAGQTLAVLDTKSMTLQLEKLEAQLAKQEVLASCLRSAEGFSDDVKDTPISDVAFAVQDAVHECRNLKSLIDLDVETIVTDLEALGQQRAMLQHKIRLHPGPEDQADLDGLEEMLSVAMAVSKLDQKISLKEQELRALRLEMEGKILKKLDDVRRNISSLEETRARISQALLNPRIVATDNGKIGRTRRLPSGFRASQDVEFSVLEPSETGGYIVTFLLPLGLHDQVGIGSIAKLRLLGSPNPVPVLRGRVTKILPPNLENDGKDFLVEVRLNDADQQLVHGLGHRLALSDHGTASILEVSLEDELLAHTVSRILTRDYAQSDGIGQRVLREFGLASSE